jgi:tRNA nucleotidyltransferase (CCA-adding enzyme)
MMKPVTRITPERIQVILGDDGASVIRLASKVASDLSQPLYLVGGAVRDLAMDKPYRDLDLVLEGDALNYAIRLGKLLGTAVTTHPEFGTASIRTKYFPIDIASARAESYPYPGSLPKVYPSNIESDLNRRDFTINCMAIRIYPNPDYSLIDPFNGLKDLKQGILRVLHSQSFSDDATRIMRAARYAGRLGMSLEPATHQMLIRDLPLLASISSDRLRRELLQILKENEPELALSVAKEWMILSTLEPTWVFGSADCASFKSARDYRPPLPLQSTYLAILFMGLDKATDRLCARLNLPRSLSHIANDASYLGKYTRSINPEDLKQVYRTFSGRTAPAISAILIRGNDNAREAAFRYLNMARKVHVELDGNALIALGVPQGPSIRKAQAGLLDAKLNGLVNDTAGEISWVKRWLLDRVDS